MCSSESSPSLRFACHRRHGRPTGATGACAVRAPQATRPSAPINPATYSEIRVIVDSFSAPRSQERLGADGGNRHVAQRPTTRRGAGPAGRDSSTDMGGVVGSREGTLGTRAQALRRARAIRKVVEHSQGLQRHAGMERLEIGDIEACRATGQPWSAEAMLRPPGHKAWRRPARGFVAEVVEAAKVRSIALSGASATVVWQPGARSSRRQATASRLSTDDGRGGGAADSALGESDRSHGFVCETPPKLPTTRGYVTRM